MCQVCLTDYKKYQLLGWHNVYEEVYDNLTDTYALLGEKLTHYRDRFDFTREVFPVCYFCYVFNSMFSRI
jgi:hypothetical protein